MPIRPPAWMTAASTTSSQDLVARIPAHTPEWTNPRLGDPGPHADRAVRLARRHAALPRQPDPRAPAPGLPARCSASACEPARAATGLVSLCLRRSRPSGARSRCVPAHASTGPCRSRRWAKRRCCRSPARRTSSGRSPTPRPTQAGDLIAGLARIHGISGAAKGYQTMPVFDAGRAEPAGIDVFAESADHALWIALLAPEAPRPDQQPAVNADVLAALGGGDTGAPSLISIGVVPAMKIPEALEDVSAPSPVPVMWEITTQGRTSLETDYLTLDPLPGADGTNGLTRPGVLRLSLPDESLDLGAVERRRRESSRRRRRHCRRASTMPARAARLLAWLRLRPRAGQQVDRLPLTWVGINATDIDQRTTLGGRVLGVRPARPIRCSRCRRDSVDPATLQVQVEEPGRGYQPWYRVDDLTAISGDARVAREAAAFELDAEAGTLRFGDGVRGRVPERQMRVRLASGRFGGGRAGNLPASSLTEIAAARIDGSSGAGTEGCAAARHDRRRRRRDDRRCAAPDSVVPPSSRARGHRRGLQGAGLRSARRRRRSRRRAAPLQAARSAPGVPGRGLGDGAARPGAVGPAEPAPGSPVHRAPARTPVDAAAAGHRALRDRLRVRRRSASRPPSTIREGHDRDATLLLPCARR